MTSPEKKILRVCQVCDTLTILTNDTRIAPSGLHEHQICVSSNSSTIASFSKQNFKLKWLISENTGMKLPSFQPVENVWVYDKRSLPKSQLQCLNMSDDCMTYSVVKKLDICILIFQNNATHEKMTYFFASLKSSNSLVCRALFMILSSMSVMFIQYSTSYLKQS